MSTSGLQNEELRFRELPHHLNHNLFAAGGVNDALNECHCSQVELVFFLIRIFKKERCTKAVGHLFLSIALSELATSPDRENYCALAPDGGLFRSIAAIELS